MTRFLVRSAIIIAVAAALVAALAAVLPGPEMPSYSTVISDRNGRFVHAFLTPEGAWRFRTDPNALPERFKTLLLRQEDRWFDLHPGFNPFSMARAFVQNLSAGRRVSGASTITMQVARMLEPKERTVANKLLEIFRAIQLEQRYSKEEILGLYLSLVPLGGNIEGLAAGAQLYYQIPLERLSIARQVDLILIPNNPNRYRPDVGTDALLARRRARAEQWHRLGLVSDDEAEILENTPAGARRQPLPRLAPHFASRVRESSTRPDVPTTLDLDLQRKAEDRLGRHVRAWRAMGVRHGAVLVVENATANVVAYAGSADLSDTLSGSQVDAVRAFRSPGSTLKPFLYAHAFDDGTLSPKQVLLDVPYDADGYTAENYDGTFSGSVRADDALRRSLNTPMIRMLDQAGLPPVFALLERAGFTTISRQAGQLGLSFIVGGCGTTLEELTAGYAALANSGRYRPLRYVADAPRDSSPQPVCSPSAAWMVSEILSDPGEVPDALAGPRIALKTGTSYGRRDAWCIGFSATHTIGVWVGNLDNVGSPDLVGSRAAMPLLSELFASLTPASTAPPVPRPDDIDTRIVCVKSGLLAGPDCRTTMVEPYSRTHTLQKACTVEQEFALSTDRRFHFCPSCLGRNAHRVSTIDVYPPELIAYWRSTGRPVTLPPPHNPSCTRTLAQEPPRILSPSDRMTYYLVQSTQQIALRAAPAASVQKHHWYIDRAFIATQPAGRELLVTLPAGQHAVTCVDDRGQRSTVTVTIRNAL
jgi:penicillin-binding protein 1C